MNFTLYTKNMQALSKVAKFQPCESNIFKDISSSLNAIYVDFDEEKGEEVLYDVPTCSIMELRGGITHVKIPIRLWGQLIYDHIPSVQDDTLLYYFYSTYLTYCRLHPNKFKDNFLGYITYVLSNDTPYEDLLIYIESLLPEDSITFHEDLQALIDICDSDPNSTIELE